MFHILLYCRVYLCFGKVAAYANKFCNDQRNITGCYYIEHFDHYKSCGQLCNGSKVLSKIKEKCDDSCPG